MSAALTLLRRDLGLLLGGGCIQFCLLFGCF